MKKTLLTITLALCAIGFSASAEEAAKKEEILIVADEWCPYTCEEGSDDAGFAVDVAREIFAENNVEMKYKTVSFARAKKGVLSGDFAGILNVNKAEAEGMIMPDEMTAISIYNFFTTSDSGWKYTGEESLKDATFGAPAEYDNYPFNGYLERNKDNTKLVQMIADEDFMNILIDKMLKGRVSAIFNERSVVNYNLKKRGLEDKIVPAGIKGFPVEGDVDYLYVGLSPKNPKSEEYAAMLSEGIRKMRESGRMKEIADKYGYVMTTVEDYNKLLETVDVLMPANPE
ncbi:MAG: hypothetical protein COV36_00295 [Alphaproteobacteria bacterium CG11_big_fil_rev_8_21_14_0_20_44_7]|nr:MAG: hypothetical protein COV36_00295 [Alphaproteobacteria bacterium CG11_big_fil_rev_8_21_14_0_20_44_7]